MHLNSEIYTRLSRTVELYSSVICIFLLRIELVHTMNQFTFNMNVEVHAYIMREHINLLR